MTDPQISQPYASIGRRFMALLLDALFLLIPVFIASWIIPHIGPVLAWFFYSVIFECSELMATPGKHAMGIQVTDMTGNRLKFPAALLRNILKLISSVLCFIGHFFAFFTEKSQAFHDLIAESVVVYGRIESPFWPAWLESFRSVFGWKEPEGRLEKLERLQSLRERGALSEEEFEREKAKL